MILERCHWAVFCRIAWVALTVAAAVAVFLSGAPHAAAWALTVALSLGYVGYRLQWVEVEIGDAGLGYGFRGIRNRIPWDRVRSVRVETYRALRYGGWGWRIGGVRDRAYSVIGARRGLRVEYQDDRGRDATVFLAARDPERLADAANGKLS